jgi:integrase
MRDAEPYLYKKNGVYWARKRSKGKAYYERLETADRGTARKRANQWWASKLKELIATNWGENPKPTFADTLDRFSEEHLPTLRDRGADRYVSSMVHLGEFFGDLNLDQITTSRLREFETARARKVKSPTIRRDLACLSSIFSFAQEYELVAHNPIPAYMSARKRRGLTESDPRNRFLSPDEEDAILAHCDDAMRLRVCFAIDQGLRMSEQFGAEWRHVNFNVATSLRTIRSRGEIKVIKELSKSKRERVVPLLDRTYDMLKFADRKHKMIFPTQLGEAFTTRSSVWETFKRVAKKAGVEGVTWHDLRRTCGCRLLQVYRFQMIEVSGWMGHSSVKVTEKHYAFLGADTLHRAVEKGRENVLDFAPRATQTATSG